MKISRQTRFPYPVLSGFTGDYVKGEFSVVFELSESLRTGALEIRYEVNLAEESLATSVTQGKAQVCIFVTCLETYYNKLHSVSLTPGRFEVEKGMLNGNVTMLPLVVAISDFRLSSENLHPDYETNSFDYENSSVLATGEEFTINVGREKLAPVESIFTLARNDSIPPGEVRVDPDQEKISILAEQGTYTEIFNIRNNALGKAILLNSIYLPALMEVLSAVSQDQAAYSDRNWFRVFEAKCTHMGINMEKPELLEASQKLLKTPFPRVVRLLREMD